MKQPRVPAFWVKLKYPTCPQNRPLSSCEVLHAILDAGLMVLIFPMRTHKLRKLNSQSRRQLMVPVKQFPFAVLTRAWSWKEGSLDGKALAAQIPGPELPPSTHGEKSGVGAHVCNPSAGGIETGVSGSCWAVSLAHCKLQAGERAQLGNKIRWTALGVWHLRLFLWPQHEHMCTCTHT